MSISRASPTGWLQETGTQSRATPGGWVQETAVLGGPAVINLVGAATGAASVSGNLSVPTHADLVGSGTSLLVIDQAPAADVTAGDFTPSSGASLYAAINEAVASDSTYISGTTMCEVKLAAIVPPLIPAGAPTSSSPFTVKFRAWDGGSGAIKVSLLCGTTLLSAYTFNTTTTPTAYSFAIANKNAALITDFSDVRLRFEASPLGSGTIYVSWAELYSEFYGATANASMTQLVPMASVAAITATATGTMSSNVLLTGSANAQASASGAMGATTVALAAASTVSATATGGASLTVPLDAVAASAVTTTASIMHALTLLGAAVAVPNALGSVFKAVPVIGSANAFATASAPLTQAIGMTAYGVARASATLALSNGVQLTGGASALALAVGNILKDVPLLGSVFAQSGASSDLGVNAGMTGKALATAAGIASLSQAVLIAGKTAAQALSQAAITVTAQVVMSALHNVLAVKKEIRSLTALSESRLVLVTKENRTLTQE